MKKLSLLLMAMIASLASWAVTPPSTTGATPESGKVYYLYNVGAAMYMNHGSSWGTHVTVDGAGCEITLGGSEGAYTLHQAGIADEKFQTEDGWSDNVTPGLFSFEAASADGYTNVYYLKCSNGKYYYWSGGIGQYGDEAVVGDTPDSFTDAYKWILVPTEDRKALTVGADVTYLIKNPDFTAYKKDFGKACTTDWTGDGVTNWAAEGIQATYYSGQFAEKWVASPGPLGDITHHQTLSGLPAGKYALSVNAQSILQGNDVAGTGAYVYAGNDQTELGLYGTYSVEFLCTGTDVEIGVKTVSTTANWLSFDKFRLTYLGEINYTDLIVNADLSTTGGWDATGTKGIADGQAKVGSGANFDFKQTITLPAGQYKVTAQAAYRYGGSEADEYAAIAAGTDTHFFKLYATVGADEASVNVKNRWEGATDAALAGTSAVEVNGKYVPNSSADVLTYMRAGQYDNELVFNITENGPVTLGITRTGTPSVGDYGNIGAWKLERLGNADPTAVIKANIAAAEALQGEKMQTTVSEALADAITAAKAAVESGEGIEAANTALKAAIAAAETSIAAYAKAAVTLPEMKALTESTNFYTEEALKAYYTDPAAAYEAGTMTNEEATALQNPYAQTGWHANLTCDDLLLSTWKIGDVQCKDYETSLYINTWSVEGNTDGSEFKVPFFEYWTGDAASLGATTLTGTINDVEPGDYNVTAWVRVRLNNNSVAQTATGITLNGVDVCAGEQVGETQFRLMEVTAPATVGADGILTAQFTVEDGNNISWLSFQNVKYAKASTPGGNPYEEGKQYVADEAQVPEAGKYYLINLTGSLLTSDGKMTSVAKSANYFWQIEDAGDGNYYVKNDKGYIALPQDVFDAIDEGRVMECGYPVTDCYDYYYYAGFNAAIVTKAEASKFTLVPDNSTTNGYKVNLVGHEGFCFDRQGNDFGITNYNEASVVTFCTAKEYVPFTVADGNYTFKNKRSGSYAAWTGDDTQMSENGSKTLATVWTIADNGDGSYKLGNYGTENFYAGVSSFTAEGAPVYIDKSAYNEGYVVVSLKSDFSGQCWDDQSGYVGYWQPSASDNQGTSWEMVAISDEEIAKMQEKESKTYAVTIPEDATLKVGAKANFITATTAEDDNAHWYVMTQVRNGESPMYDNGVGATLNRATTDVTPTTLNGADANENAKYLVRFVPAETEGTYNVQFATGNFIQSSLTTGKYGNAGEYWVYMINSQDTHIAWNLNSDGEKGKIVDNNGAGNTLAFWGTGEVANIGGNNDWSVYPVEFAPLTKTANFNALTPLEAGVRTYAKDIKEEGETSGLNDIEGWSHTASGDAMAGGVFAYGGDTKIFLGGDGYAAPATNPKGEATGNALGLVAVWTATAEYTTTMELPAGKYEMSVPVYNAGGTGAITNHIGINTLILTDEARSLVAGPANVYSTSTTYPVGEWTTETVKISLPEASAVTISLGYTAANAGSGSMPHLFYDGVEIVKTGTAAEAMTEVKNAAIAELDALPAGDGLFYYTVESVAAAKEAVNAATTVYEINEAKALVIQNTPVAGRTYVIKNNTAEGNLSVNADNVTIAPDAFVYFTAVEGGYAISNTDGKYIFKTSDNNWTLTTTENLEEAYVLNANIVDGGYTLKGAKGLLGTNAAEKAANSIVYANKTVSDGNAVWSISTPAVYVASSTFDKDGGELTFNTDVQFVGDEEETQFITCNVTNVNTKEVATTATIKSVDGKKVFSVEFEQTLDPEEYTLDIPGNVIETAAYEHDRLPAQKVRFTVPEPRFSFSDLAFQKMWIETSEGEIDFAQPFTYNGAILDGTDPNYIQTYMKYDVVNAAGETVKSGEASLDITNGSAKIWFEAEEDLAYSTEYTIKPTQVYVKDNSKADWETNFGDIIVVTTDLPSYTFTTPAEPRIVMNDVELEDPEGTLESDGTYQITMYYSAFFKDETLDNEYLDSKVYFTVYDKAERTMVHQEYNPSTLNLTKDRAGIWLSGLEANKGYDVVIDSIVVKNNKEMDPETQEAPVIFVMKHALPSALTICPEPYEAPYIVVTPEAGTVTELKDFHFELSDGTDIAPCSDNTYDLYITNEAGEKVAIITQDALQAGVVTDESGWTVLAVNVSLDNAITTPGTYTLNIPEGAFYITEDYINCPEMTVEYTIEATIDLAGQWYENTTGQYYDNYGSQGADWYDFAIENGSVTATQEGNTLTLTGLLNNSKNKIVGTIDAKANTITFAKDQAVYYGGYDWTLTSDPWADDIVSDLVATINEDGTLSLDGLNIMYYGSSYMYDTKITLSRKQTAINNIEESNETKDGKYLINGKLVIVKNGKKYNANGARMN